MRSDFTNSDSLSSSADSAYSDSGSSFDNLSDYTGDPDCSSDESESRSVECTMCGLSFDTQGMGSHRTACSRKQQEAEMNERYRLRQAMKGEFALLFTPFNALIYPASTAPSEAGDPEKKKKPLWERARVREATQSVAESPNTSLSHSSNSNDCRFTNGPMTLTLVGNPAPTDRQPMPHQTERVSTGAYSSNLNYEVYNPMSFYTRCTPAFRIRALKTAGVSA